VNPFAAYVNELAPLMALWVEFCDTHPRAAAWIIRRGIEYFEKVTADAAPPPPPPAPSASRTRTRRRR
jgi:hypothetical protein